MKKAFLKYLLATYIWQKKDEVRRYLKTPEWIGLMKP